jgi:hypothetical protein
VTGIATVIFENVRCQLAGTHMRHLGFSELLLGRNYVRRPGRCACPDCQRA